MRSLVLFVIGVFFGTAFGFLLGGGVAGSGHAHDHAGHSDASHDHGNLVPWEGTPPTLALALSPDAEGAQDLHIMTEGFLFAPEQVNGPNTPGTGHAHVYVNGEKVMRAYGAWVHLDNVPEKATIRVTLNSNDHSGWGLDGMPIAAEVTAP